MKTYRIYQHPRKRAPVVVKVGFSWPAFIIGPLWFLLNGMWLNFVIVTALVGTAHIYFRSAPENLWVSLLALIYLVIWFLVGKWANAMLGSDLRTEGYQVSETVQARNASQAREKAARPLPNPEAPSAAG